MTLLCQINVPTQVRIPFRMVDETNGTSPEPGLSPSAFICGPTGDTYAAAAGGITEISNGDYVYAPTTADVNASGVVLTRFTGTGAMEARGVPVQVVGFDPTSDLGAATRATINSKLTGSIAAGAGGTLTIGATGVTVIGFTAIAALFPTNFSTTFPEVYARLHLDAGNALTETKSTTTFASGIILTRTITNEGAATQEVATLRSGP